MADLASLVVRLQADNSQYIKALDQATAKLKQHSEDSESLFEKMGESLNELAGEIAAAFTIDALIEFSAAAIEAQASVQKMSQETGVSVEKLSTLNLAFAEAGLSSDQTATAMKKLGQAVSDAAGDPASKAGIAFKLLGINVKDSAGNIRDLSDITGDIASKFSQLADGPNKTALAIALLGKQGQQLIPFLNQGSEGFDRISQSAADAGAALTGPMAEAAEGLEKKLNLLKAEAVQGLGNAIAAELIPALNTLADAWTAGGGKASAYATIASGIGLAFKTLATIALEVGQEFETMGSAIGGAAAAIGAALTGNFAQAKTILEAQHADALAINQKYADATAALWQSAADKEIEAAKHGAEGAGDAAKKPDAPNLKAGEETAKADAELEKFSGSLKEQAEAYGLGELASVRFKLATGALGEAMKVADEAGKKAAASALQYAAALQQKKDIAGGDKMIAQLVEQAETLDASAKTAFTYKLNVGELGASLDRLAKSGHDLRPALEAAFDLKLVAEDEKAVAKINDQLLVMAGRLKDAAANQFDTSNKALKGNLTDTGDTAGLAKLDELRQSELAQKAYDEEVQKATKIQQDYATAIANINLLKAQGRLTDVQANAQTEAAQQQQITDLTAVYNAEKAITDQNPNIIALANSTQQFANQITALKTQTNALEQSVRQNLESAFADNFSKLISGAESFRNALKNFMADIEKMFINMIAKDYAQKLFAPTGAGGGAVSGLAGLFGGGGAGGSTGGAASLFAGLFADGGTIQHGQFGIVGENGPELAYAGSGPMSIAPAQTGGKSTSVVNHFSVQSDNGQISRASQMQLAAAAARSVSQASRRNNR